MKTSEQTRKENFRRVMGFVSNTYCITKDGKEITFAGSHVLRMNIEHCVIGPDGKVIDLSPGQIDKIFCAVIERETYFMRGLQFQILRERKFLYT